MKRYACRFSTTILVVLLAAAPLCAEDGRSVPPGADTGIHPAILFGCLAGICFLIGIFATIGGIGGGVIFTPLFMGFTSIDSYIIRTTGLFIALCGTVTASRTFLSRGVANFRLAIVAALPCAACATAGSILAAYIEYGLGDGGDAFIEGALGIIVIAVACMMVIFGSRTEYPPAVAGDRLAAMFSLAGSYEERSLQRPVDYTVTRTLPGMLLFGGVGFISGLFGLGGGWAMVPVYNLVMLVPLKAAAACSATVISISNTAAVWPYILKGGMFPLFAFPCMVGMIAGAAVGSRIMMRVKASYVRMIILILMVTAGIRLIAKALFTG